VYSQGIKGSWLRVDVPVGAGPFGELKRVDGVREAVAAGLWRSCGVPVSSPRSEMGKISCPHSEIDTGEPVVTVSLLRFCDRDACKSLRRR